MSSKLLALALLTALTSAQSTTVTLFLPDTDSQSLVASVIAADSSATTYALTCPSDTPGDECGYEPAATITAGPSLAAGSLAVAGASEVWSCELRGPSNAATAAACEITAAVGSVDVSAAFSQLGYTDISASDYAAATSALASASIQPTTSIVSTTLSGSDIAYFPVVITAGQEKLAAASNDASATTGSTLTTSASGSASKATGSVSKATGSASKATGASGTATGSSAAQATTNAASNVELGFSAAGVAAIALAALAL